MKSIKIAVLPVRDGDVVSGVLIRQQKRGDSWVNLETITVVSNQPGAERILLMENNERLIVEAESNSAVFYDVDQRVATTVPVDVSKTATPLSNDGDESPSKPAVDRAMEPAALSEAAAQERRDAAITAARDKLKEAPPKEAPKDDEKGLGPSAAPSVTSGATPSPSPPKK